MKYRVQMRIIVSTLRTVEGIEADGPVEAFAKARNGDGRVPEVDKFEDRQEQLISATTEDRPKV